MSDPYATLGIGRDASAAQIRAAYRRQAQASHPDRGADRGGSTERMAAINNAYQVLSDPARRAHVDRVLDTLDPELDGIKRLVARKSHQEVRRVLEDIRTHIRSFTDRGINGFGGPLNSPQLALYRRQAELLEGLLA